MLHFLDECYLAAWGAQTRGEKQGSAANARTVIGSSANVTETSIFQIIDGTAAGWKQGLCRYKHFL